LLALLGEDQALQKTRLRILRIRGERAVHALERLRLVARLEQLLRILDVTGACNSKKSERTNQRDTATEPLARGV